METQVCEKCGRELQLSSFPRWVNKDGTIKAFHHCYKCVNEEQREKRNARKRTKLIMSFSDEEILREAKRRQLI